MKGIDSSDYTETRMDQTFLYLFCLNVSMKLKINLVYFDMSMNKDTERHDVSKHSNTFVVIIYGSKLLVVNQL